MGLTFDRGKLGDLMDEGILLVVAATEAERDLARLEEIALQDENPWRTLVAAVGLLEHTGGAPPKTDSRRRAMARGATNVGSWITRHRRAEERDRVQRMAEIPIVEIALERPGKKPLQHRVKGRLTEQTIETLLAVDAAAGVLHAIGPERIERAAKILAQAGERAPIWPVPREMKPGQSVPQFPTIKHALATHPDLFWHFSPHLDDVARATADRVTAEMFVLAPTWGPFLVSR